MRILIAALLAFSAFASSPESADTLYIPEQYGPLLSITGWAQADVPKLAEVVECESGWDNYEIGAAGELGLFQIMPGTWEDARARLGADVPPAWEVWTNPAAQFYVARVIHRERGWEPWTCG